MLTFMVFCIFVVVVGGIVLFVGYFAYHVLREYSGIQQRRQREQQIHEQLRQYLRASDQDIADEVARARERHGLPSTDGKPRKKKRTRKKAGSRKAGTG